MMFRYIASLSYVLLLIVGSSQSALAEPAMATVSDDDTTIHILGTVHALPAGLEWWSDDLGEALESSQAIYFETDSWNGGVDGMAFQMLIRGVNPSGTALSNMMSKQAWARVVEFAEANRISENGLERMQPWIAAQVLAGAAQRSAGVQFEQGVDARLLNNSQKQSRELRYFNSSEEQIRFMSDLPLEIQLAMLFATVRGDGLNERPTDQIMEMWAEGDLEGLDRVSNQAMRDFSPELFDVLIVGRNAAWVEELSELMGEPGVYFVAVGAAHLPGGYGMIELMRARGFDVVVN